VPVDFTVANIVLNSALHYTTVHYITLQCLALHYTALHSRSNTRARQGTALAHPLLRVSYHHDKYKLQYFIVTVTRILFDICDISQRLQFLPFTEPYMAHMMMVLTPKNVVY
jgi:hypothetical protein